MLQKCEAFLTRRYLKARDAFDIHLLLGLGASLSNNLQAHLEDLVLLRDLDAEFIEARIQRVDVKLCTTDLRSVLPSALFNELSAKQFAPIGDSLRKVFSEWVEEN